MGLQVIPNRLAAMPEGRADQILKTFAYVRGREVLPGPKPENVRFHFRRGEEGAGRNVESGFDSKIKSQQES